MAEAALLALSKIGSYAAIEAAMVAKSKISNLMELSATVQRIRRQFLMMNFFIRKMGASYLSDELLKGWIAEVRMLAYRVEDVLDSFFYHSIQFKKDKFLNKIVKGSHYAVVFNAIADELVQIEKDIEHVSKLKDMWVYPVSQLIPTQVTISEHRFPQYSFPRLMKDEDLVGMENNRQHLKQLFSHGISALRVISVWGMGGMGKTTLVLNVYEQHKEKFDINVWLTVSQAFSVEALLRKLLREIRRRCELTTPGDGDSVNKEQQASDETDKLEVSQLKELKDELKKALMRKRFMVVLDDVWNRQVFDMMHDVFEDFRNGSRVVITTRRGDVAALAHEGCQLKLNPLELNDALLLFSKKAFPNSNDLECPLKLEDLATDIAKKSNDSSLTECRLELNGLATDIAEKCNYLPLANSPAQTLETVEASKDLGEHLEKMIQLRNLWIGNIKAGHCAQLLASLSKMPLLYSLLLCASDEEEKLNIEKLVPTSTMLQKLIIRGCTSESTLECPVFQDHGRRLKYLALSRCHLGHDALERLEKCVPNLTYLSLNKVHTNGAHTLVLPAKSFPLLKTLVLRNMSNVNLLKIGADALKCIEGLYIVSLSNLKSVPEGIESLSSLKKLTLLGLHNDFKAEWNKKRMHEKMKHVTELRV
uniref:NB-ARC domain-containing protein n=1 Tax=Oryza rufipogon TaxID=4529 RepID=A0A0E0R608_ORYRU